MTLDGTNCVFWGVKHDRDLVRCVGELGNGQKLSVSLYGAQPNKVTNMVISLNGEPPLQNLELRAQPIIDRMNVGLVFSDVNFDGFTDLAIMESGSMPGPQKYLHFLYNSDLNKYIENKSLWKISPVKIEKDARTLAATWRKSRALSGHDSYKWRKSELVLIERIVRYETASMCEESVFRRTGAHLELAHIQPCD